MRILVATDFSTRSQRAVRRAGVLARGNSKEVLLMHVVDGLATDRIAPHLREAQRIILEQIAVVPEIAGIPCEPLVIGGSPCDAILDAAADWEVDLIVVGAPHDLSARESGRTVKRLIRESPCPVLVVGHAAIRPYSRILAPVDLSEISSQALEKASSLKLIGKADVTVLHAFEALAKGKLTAFGVSRPRVEAYVDNWRSSSAEEVEVLLSDCGLTERQWSKRIEEGPPLEVICRVTQQMRPDLLIIGTRGLTGIRRALSGSVTEGVLAAVGMDVLVVPPHASRVVRAQAMRTGPADVADRQSTLDPSVFDPPRGTIAVH